MSTAEQQAASAEAPPPNPYEGQRLTGAEAVVRSLELCGVEICFGIPGGAILPIYDALASTGTKIKHVLVRHEQGAGHMAQGYARATGRVGVAMATSGPGATNLVTPVADAFLDSTPLVIVTGQVPSHLIGTDAFQEADTTGIFMPIVKHSYLITKVEDIPRVFMEAFHLASTGRPGPVLIDVPKDIANTAFTFRWPKQIDLPGYRPTGKGHPLQVQEAALAIARAKKPVLYVGGGVINAGAEAELRALAEETRIPVVTTLMAKGAFPDSHALSLQMPGMHGSKFANWAIHRSDLLITVGARFDDRVTGKLDAFAPGAKVIHMDIDPAEISKNRTADVPIVGELREVLPQLTKAIAKLRESDSIINHREWLEQVEEWKFKYPFRYRRAGALKPEYVIERLRDLCADRDTIWTTGVGQHQMWAAQWLRIDDSRRWITSGGLGTMGFGFPAALGAKLGRPEATVVCIDGDGCFQMTLQELATAVVYEIPVIVAVMNNGWLGMVRQWQELFHDERFSQTHLNAEIPDYVKLAEAFGAVGFRADREEEVDDAIRAALASGRPAVIDFRVDHEEKVYPMVPAGAASADMMDAAWIEDDNSWVEEGV
ncbi:MAG: acetolactate synthase large subunit [Gaiellales bacterium]|nr:acetolactate synthase large subunit [Gaiellales bacterium]